MRRLQSQWPNERQVEHANVVLSTLWEPEVTRKQVRAPMASHDPLSPAHFSVNVPLALKVLKAWNLLQERIQQRQ